MHPWRDENCRISHHMRSRARGQRQRRANTYTWMRGDDRSSRWWVAPGKGARPDRSAVEWLPRRTALPRNGRGASAALAPLEQAQLAGCSREPILGL